MSDVAILKRVLEQETAAEKRYAEQISRLCDGEIKQIFVQIKEGKRQNKEDCARQIKKLEKKFDDKASRAFIDMDLNTLLCATLPEIISYLEVDETKECDAKKLIDDSAKKVKSKDAKKLLDNFLKSTQQHLDKISELLRRESID